MPGWWPGRYSRPVGSGRRPRKTGTDLPYIMSHLPSEIDRLDLQHYALRLVLQTNYVAPIGKPTSILDVGSGTGQWAFDLCEQFPQARVIGLDLNPSKSGQPANYRFVRANVLRGLPLASDQFDFVHQRLMFAAIPVVEWKGLVADFARVTRPGGWVELVEFAEQFDDPGPATEEMHRLYRSLASARGLDTTEIVFRSLDRWLRDAGLVSVTRREVRIPVGELAGRAGSMMATDVRNGIQGLLGLLQQQGRISREEAADLLQRIQAEWQERRTTYPMAIAWGRRPSRPGEERWPYSR